MNSVAQTIIAICIVVLAAAYLSRLAWRYYIRLKEGKGCACDGGGNGKSRSRKVKVQLEPPRRREGS